MEEIETGDDILMEQLCEGMETYRKDLKSTFLARSTYSIHFIGW